MLAYNIDEVRGNDQKFKVCNAAEKLVIDNEQEIPKEFFNEVITLKLDKDKLRNALKNGPIDGAHLEKNRALRIY